MTSTIDSKDDPALAPPTVSPTEHEKEQTENAVVSALATLGDAASKIDGEENEEFEIPQRFTKSGRKRAIPFPLKLMKVLSNKEYRHIITWMPSGESFSIIKPKAFVSDVLPEFFKSAKYSSFTRKLHRWGFMRHYRGEESGAFYHKDFKKDRLDLVEKMTCHKTDSVKSAPAVSTAASAARKVEAEPCDENEAENKVLPSLPTKALTEEQLAPRPAAAAAAAAAQSQQAPQHPPQQQQLVPMSQPPEITARLQQQLQGLSKVPELDAAERLHAAIELEVNRRLNERIEAAAMSRRAIESAMMRSQMNAPRGLPLFGGSLQTQLLQMQQQKQQMGLEAACLAFSGFPRMSDQGLDELPPTNIQGAKTA